MPERLAALSMPWPGRPRSGTGPRQRSTRLRALLHRHERWLVVFDNAEDPRALTPWIPAGPGRVLITSRNPHWGGTASPVGLGKFTRDESVALLHTLAPHLTPADADRVAEAVGDLPLALDQAGLLLATTPMDVPTYLQLLAERAADTFDHDPRRAYPSSLTASWAVASTSCTPVTARAGAADAAGLAGPGTGAAHPDHRERRRPADDAPRAHRSAAVEPLSRLLTSRGLVTATATELLLHRVPAALLRARTADHRTGGSDWRAVVIGLLCGALPDNVWDSPDTLPRWQQLAPHVLVATDADRHPEPDDALAVRTSHLLDRLARYRWSRGESTATSTSAAGRSTSSSCTPDAGPWERITPTRSPQPIGSPAICLRLESTSRPAPSPRTP